METAEPGAISPRLGALSLLMQQGREPPRFGSARNAIQRAFRDVAFPKRITPMEAADEHRHLRNPGAYSGPWRDSPEPMQHLVEPTNNLAMTSPYSIVAVIGPSQMGKSEIGNNWQVHSVIYDPVDMAFYAPTKELTASYVTTQIDKLLEECPDVGARQLKTASADNIFLKQFRGCDWHFLWPTGPNFRARPFSRGRCDDYDDFRMRRPEPGPAYVALPRDMNAKHIAELRAEEKVEGLWEKPEGVRNESWDLFVYALFVIMRLVGLDQNLTRVPTWARPPKPKGPVVAQDPDAPTPSPEPPRPTPPTPRITRAAPPPGPARPALRRGIRVVRSS